MNHPHVSVLIPAYNEEAFIGRVIESVHQSFASIPERPYEIIVCDNNSTDNTAEIATAKGAKIVFEPHNQIARARNAAARAAQGQWFIFLDADTFLNPQLLSRTLMCLETGKIVGGGATLAFDKDSISLFAVVLTRIWNCISVVARLAAGSYVFCTRDAWSGVSGFDEQFYAGEELFFSRKLKKVGATERAAIHHHHSRASRDLSPKIGVVQPVAIAHADAAARHSRCVETPRVVRLVVYASSGMTASPSPARSVTISRNRKGRSV